MKKTQAFTRYFPFSIQIATAMWQKLGLDEVNRELHDRRLPDIMFFRQLAERLNHLPGRRGLPVQAGMLNLYALLTKILRHVVNLYAAEQQPGILEKSLMEIGVGCSSPELHILVERFGDIFPGVEILSGAESNAAAWLAGDDGSHTRKQTAVMELLLLSLANENRAVAGFRNLFDDAELAATSSYRSTVSGVERKLASAPPVIPFGRSLPELLRAPLQAAPESLYDQLEFIRKNWQEILPLEMVVEISSAFAVVQEESRIFAPRGEPGGIDVLEFSKKKGRGSTSANDYYPEPENFSPDVDWMSRVVLIAKMVYVWLWQLSCQYDREIKRLDQIPDEELDRLARWGFTGLWLIGIWERSPASQRIKQITGNPDAIASAYSLFDYVIAHDLGGEEAFNTLKERARKRGIRLASDMVPNHTGIYSRWTLEHPDWFVQLDYPPYPAYTFNGPDLSVSGEISLHIEDGYWDKRDAAVVFKHYDHRDGRTRYIYHGNDGTSTPWNDTAQLNYLLPELRETVIRTILHVARMTPIIRFDAAMTLAKKHYQRLWYPQPGHGGVPSRGEHGMTRDEFEAAFPVEFWREVVDRVAAEAPDTLLLAEAFWLMEGYFVRTLGMHRVYNSAFMNMLKLEENAKYRQTVKNVLEFNPEVLKRFVNFMNNPDEKTAVEQFGKEGKYFGAAVLLATMPGLPMFGHGQIEGFHEKYGMEYKRSYWDEPVDEHLVKLHEQKVFPLMRRRWLFAGADNFVFYDFFVTAQVDENVFAYSNRAGNERGIILYNNRYGATKGWIRTSTAMAVRNDAGDTVLVQKTLGSALDFKGDGRHYYGFHDYGSGLEFIRNGRELCQEGLFVELEAYEFHAFLDFREIYDDDFGTWGKLCHQLEGAGVASLEEEVKQVRFEALINRLREVIDLHGGLLTGSFAELGSSNLVAAKQKFSNDLEEFLTALAAQAELTASAAPLAVAAQKELAFLEELTAEPAEKKTEMQFGVLAGITARLLAFAWLCLHRVGEMAKGEKLPEATFDLIQRFGLIRPLEEDLFAEATDADDPLATLPVESVVELFQALLRWQGYLVADVKKQGEELPELLAHRTVAAFICRHASGGYEWFVKERWEMLVKWLTLAGLVNEAGTAKSGKVSASRRKVVEQAAAALLQRAEKGGFRVDRMLLEEGKKARG